MITDTTSWLWVYFMHFLQKKTHNEVKILYRTGMEPAVNATSSMKSTDCEAVHYAFP
jgi:hypothetical protein